MKQDARNAIEQLVLAVAGKASKSAKNLREQMEALRVLTPYYTVLTKTKGALPEGEGESVSIRSLQDAVNRAEDTNG